MQAKAYVPLYIQNINDYLVGNKDIHQNECMTITIIMADVFFRETS